MSLNQSATRRLSLMAGSSLVAAALLLGAPQAAFAYDECVPANPPITLTDGTNGVSDPTLNATLPDNFTCSATTYATGITYTSNGALTVTKSNTTVTTVTANGVNLVGSGADSVTWDSSAGGLTGGTGTAGPVIEATSGSGAISITTAAVTANAASTTYGIYAKSTGGGAITITRAVGGVNNGVAGGLAAIYAESNGGALNITTASGFTTGRARGVVAKTSGTGTVTVTLNGQVSADAAEGVVALDIAAGTGATTVNITNGTLTGGAGAAIVVNSAGAVTINNTGGVVGNANSSIPTAGGSVNFSGLTGPGVIFNNTGTTSSRGVWAASGASIFTAGADTLSMSGIGLNYVASGASINLGAGADTFNMSAFLNLGLHAAPNNAVLDFGAGTDTFNMSGVFSTHTVALFNLEVFNNSGVIYLGAGAGSFGSVDFTKTDSVANDRLTLAGATFTGSGNSRIALDIYLDGTVQTGCDTLSGAADCLYLPGGATAGRTLLTLNILSPESLQGGYDPVGVTIVDVAGGTSAASHFAIDPATANYFVDPLHGAAVDRPGLFVYSLQYNPANQRHAMVSLPRGEVLEYAMLGSAGQSIWHMTSRTVTDRQRDLRAGVEKTVWLRTSGQYSKRDMDTAFETGVGSMSVDTSYKLYAGTIMAGRDFITGGAGGHNYVFGAQIGYVGSGFELQTSPTSGRFTGATGGVYASAWGGSYFVDGTINSDFLTLDYESAGLATKTNTYMNSVGARLEGGMRLGLGERAFAEPLASVAFSRTSFEEISLSGGVVAPDSTQSTRAGLGLRLGADFDGGAINLGYSVTGRVWRELDGVSDGLVMNPGQRLPFTDDAGGGFGEAQAGLELSNDAGTVSGFVNAGVQFREGLSTVDLGGGVRVVW